MPDGEHETRARRVRVGTATLRCSVLGDHGRPLLLVNGLGANLELWAPLRRALGSRATVAFDVPGTGGSDPPRRPLTIAALAGLTVGLADELGLETFDLLGYSFGGAIAQQVAYSWPDCVHRMILASTTCGWGGYPGSPLAVLTLLAGAPVAVLPPMSASLRSLTGDDGSPRAFSAASKAWAARPPNPLAYVWHFGAAMGWSSWAWLPGVQAPTLVLAGEHDRLAPPANARLLARRLPHAVLRVVPGAGHFFLVADDPRPAAAAIEEFLDAQPDGSACT